MPRERDISRILAARENGACEVKTPVGYIDVLTPTVLYEVKDARSWKGALGQALAYSTYYPAHKIKLYLYGAATSKQKLLITEQCATHNVGVIWHREPAPDEPPPPPQVVAPVIDRMKLVLAVIDEYANKANSTISLQMPTERVDRQVLDAYLDHALAVFDALLGNHLTLTLRYIFGGEETILTRARAAIVGKPVLYRLHISMLPSTRIPFSVSLPGIRARLSNGYPIQPDADYAQSTQTSEMVALRELILHPTFPWMSRRNEPALAVVHMMRTYTKR